MDWSEFLSYIMGAMGFMGLNFVVLLVLWFVSIIF